MVYSELGRYPLIVERKFRIIKYWLKIVTNGTSQLVLDSYKSMYSQVDENNNIINWAVCGRDLLLGLGFWEVWYQQGVANKSLFLRTCRQRLRDQYIQQWYGPLRDRSSCLLYQELKNEFDYSEYLKSIKCHKWRVALTRFRTRNHLLENVTMGQGHRPLPYNKRLCVECGVLGDEYHCVFECKKNEHLHSILPAYYRRRPSMVKLIQLMTTARVSELNKLSKFLYKMQMLPGQPP